ncbi:MAG: VRR-NUC domain-containing protein [Clostridiales bacterium]|nr:VRR-NUC domain-containing protein [Clostridiales bacterium]
MKEKQIEQILVREVRAKGGICPKLVSPGTGGMPDRIILLPGGVIAFAELKAPGRKPGPLQAVRINQLRKLGFPVYVIDSPDMIGETIRTLTGPYTGERNVK